MTKVNIHKQTNELRSKRKHPLLLWGIGIGIRYWWLFILIEKALEMGIASCQLHTRTDTQIAYEKTNRTRTNYRIFKIKETKFHQYFNLKKKWYESCFFAHLSCEKRKTGRSLQWGNSAAIWKPKTHHPWTPTNHSNLPLSFLGIMLHKEWKGKLQATIFNLPDGFQLHLRAKPKS